MNYTIGEISELMDISADTLRYYDKEGLLPFVQRGAGGRRIFTENDLNFLEVIKCLKRSGVQVKEISTFIGWCMAGDESLPQRKAFMDEKEAELEKEIKEMQTTLAFLQWKKWYYTAACKAGTESIHFIEGTHKVDPKVRERYLGKKSAHILE